MGLPSVPSTSGLAVAFQNLPVWEGTLPPVPEFVWPSSQPAKAVASKHLEFCLLQALPSGAPSSPSPKGHYSSAPPFPSFSAYPPNCPGQNPRVMPGSSLCPALCPINLWIPLVPSKPGWSDVITDDTPLFKTIQELPLLSTYRLKFLTGFKNLLPGPFEIRGFKIFSKPTRFLTHLNFSPCQSYLRLVKSALNW